MAPPNRNFTNLTSKSTSTPTRTGTNFAMAQGKGSMPTKEATRRVFFDNRPDISDDRLRRRQAQADELRAFKNDPTKTKAVNIVDPVTGKVTGTVTGLTQAATADGKTVAQREQELALKYGPTFSEIASDVSYAGGKVIGALGEKAMSGSLGIFGIVKEVANYAADKASNAYNNLTDVQKEIANNPNKYTFAEQQEKVRQLRNFRDLQSQAERDALGLEIDFLKSPGSGYQAGAEQEAFLRSPGSGYQAGTGLRSLPKPKISLEDDNYVESGQFREDLQKSGIITVDDPATQEPLFDSTKIPGQNSTIGDLKKALKDQGFNDFQIQSAVNQVTQQILSGDFTGDVEVETGSTTRGSELPNAPGGGEEEFYVSPLDQDIDAISGAFSASQIDDTPFLARTTNPSGYQDLEEGELGDLLLSRGNLPGGGQTEGTQVTAFNNPGNLTDVGQRGTTGETYGNNFAVFPNAQAGITALENDLALKVGRSNKVEDIIGQYASGDPNVGNYIDFVTSKVGPTVDQNELNDLRDAVIRFENKPDIAQQYLAMVAEGGLMDKKMYGGIISSK